MNNLILNLKIFINLLINKNSNIFKLLLFFPFYSYLIYILQINLIQLK